ncbi:MAG: sensor histidine kinase [Gemmatimonadota bacterium]
MTAPARFKRTSLRWKLPLLFAFTAAVTVAAFGLFAYRAVEESAIGATHTRLRSAVVQVNTIVELGVLNQLESVGAVARDPAVVAALQVGGTAASLLVDSALARLRTRLDTTVAVDLVRRDGIVLRSIPAHRVRRSPHGSAIPQTAALGPIHERDSLQRFQATAPVRVGQEIVGAVRVTRLIGQGTSANTRIVERIVGPEGELLVGNVDGTMWVRGRALTYPLDQPSPVIYERDGQRWVSASLPVRDSPWLYAVDLPEHVALAPARALITPFLMTGSLIALAGALLGFGVSNRITRPLGELTAATEAIARGDRNVNLVATDRHDEIGRLARAFETMATSVRSVQEKLESDIDSRTGELSTAVDRLRELHEELKQSERLATIGRLSGSVSHELRNPLGVMSNVVFLLDALPDASPRIRDYASLLREQIRLSERIISDLLDRVRSGSSERASMDVTRLLDDVLERMTIPDCVDVDRQYVAGLPQVMVDRDQVGQVLWNLVSNAVQAMQGSPGEGKEGGTLTIEASAAGDRLYVEVRDTGAGVRSEDAERIFEPLYTTNAKGVGLGLSISRAFVV